MILGRYPPRYIALENETMKTVIKGLNFRGVRYAPVANIRGNYVGLIRLLDVIRVLEKLYEENALEKFAETPVKKVTTKEVPPITLEEADVNKVVSIMSEYDVGGLAVTNQQREVIGEITENHLVDLLRHTRPLGIPVKAVMTPSPVVVKAEDTLEKALKLITEKRVRRLPVVYEEELVGILTIRDVIKFVSSKIHSLSTGDLETPIWYLSTPRPITVRENDDCYVAINTIREEGVGGLIVVDEKGYLTGMISERDLLVRLPYITNMDIISYIFEPYKQYLGL
jgi:predicted transcriptional regulator